MTPTTAEDRPRAARVGLLARLIGVLTSPGDTFARLVREPRWLDMLFVIMLVSTVCLGGFLSTEVGQQAWLDEAVRRSEAFGGNVSDAQYRGMERMLPYVGYIGAAQALAGIPLVTLVLAGILFAVFNGFLGGEATFKQLFSIVVHSGAVTTLQQVFLFPLNYMRESMSGATNLAVFLPMLEETSFVARLLGMVDLFVVWWTIVLAIGISVLYRRKLNPILISFLVVYGVIALAVAALMSGGGS